MKYKLYSTVIFLFAFLSIHPQGTLDKAWEKLNKPIKNKVVSLSFTETRTELQHGYEPWDKDAYQYSGNVWITPTAFYKKDTESTEGKTVSSMLEYNQRTMLFSDYGSDTLSWISPNEYKEQLYHTARYTPILLLEYFYKRKTNTERKTDPVHTTYNTYRETIGKSPVRLFINKETNLIDEIEILENDDFMGDVKSNFKYHYTNQGAIFIPQDITISKFNGSLEDSIRLGAFSIEKKLPRLLAMPPHYAFKEKTVPTPKITFERYNEHIYFLYLEHCDSRSLAIEFKDFIVVAEAPVNSENGSLIISEVKKHFPNKPIRYFAFGHHHPHYIGGIRAFIHEKATILSAMGDFDYVRYLSQNPHTIKPDSLQLDKKMLDINILGDKKTITDDNYSMEIYNIGDDSHHTKDYLIFYFPEEKVIFEGDLVWIPNNGKTIKKVSNRQKGFYEAIGKLNLKVETIFQSWPIKEFNYKSEIPFKELEDSVKN